MAGAPPPSSGPRPVGFITWPPPSTPGLSRIGPTIPACPKCKRRFTRLHCASCSWFWCDGCRLTYRPDTGRWFIGAGVVDNCESGAEPFPPHATQPATITDQRRSEGNWDGTTDPADVTNVGPCERFFNPEEKKP